MGLYPSRPGPRGGIESSHLEIRSWRSTASAGCRSRAQEIAARHYEIPESKRTGVSVDTLLGWALRYRNGGFEALAPKPRQDRGQFRVVTPQLARLMEHLKRENPHRTGTTLLRELALSSGQDAPAISASTL